MKVIFHNEYGSPDVLRLTKIPKPILTDNEVLVEVFAASVNYANAAMVRGKPFIVRLMTGGLLKPKHKIPGGDIAGRVEAVGKNVKRFEPGDEVYGDLSDSGFCGFAEYVSASEGILALKPSNLSFEEAAAVPQAALVALQGLRKGGIKPEQKVLIYGASGGIGTFAVQLARYFGAGVTGVCSARNLELVKSLGADHVIDYTKEDFADGSRHYDLILATAGYRPILDYKRALNPDGAYVMTGGSMAQVFQAMAGPLVAMGSGKKMGNLYHRANREDLNFMREVIEAGRVKPVIDRIFPLSKTAEALRYYEQGRSRGKVIINIKE
jgi:NADPH:quinone reductase-like Zn-dependent oxidoreductase